MSLNGVNLAQIEAFETVLKSSNVESIFSYLYYHQDRAYAQACFGKLLDKVSPVLLREYLANTSKPELVLSEQLLDLLEHASTMGSPTNKTLDANVREEWHKVTLTVAQNDYWCRTVGYPSFIKYSFENALLAKYISTHPFVIHLEAYHIAEFLRYHTVFIGAVLDMVLTLQAQKSNEAWVDEVLKNIVKHIPIQQIKAPKYAPLVTRLHALFAADRFFAKQVLKNIYLCTQWIGNGELVAYKHPLFNDDDFVELSHFFNLNYCPTVSNQYRAFANLMPPLAVSSDSDADTDNSKAPPAQVVAPKPERGFKIEMMFPEFRKLINDASLSENEQSDNLLDSECLTPRPVFIKSTQATAVTLMKRTAKSHSFEELLEADAEVNALKADLEKLKFA